MECTRAETTEPESDRGSIPIDTAKYPFPSQGTWKWPTSTAFIRFPGLTLPVDQRFETGNVDRLLVGVCGLNGGNRLEMRMKACSDRIARDRNYKVLQSPLPIS